jgi:hypothetical protein
MPRSTMSSLISLTRDLISDPSGADQTFTDDQIERSLDVFRWDFRYFPLKPLTTIVSGSVEYLDWYSDESYWESDAALYDGSYGSLSPSSSDPIHGRWSFATHQTAVLVSGKIYDPYGAAVDLLEMWAGKVALEFDVNADGASLSRSQKRAALLELAAQYRKQRRIIMTEQVRPDVW